MPKFTAQQLGPSPYLPLIDVVIRLTDGMIRSKAIIDSGADETIIPYEVLQVSGIEWASLTALPVGHGAGGAFEKRECQGSIEWAHGLIRTPLLIAEPGRLPLTLLGRADFFAKNIVKFAWHQSPPAFQVDPVTKAGGKLTTVAPTKGRRKKRR